MKHDPRITLWRDGIAARSLEGVLEAEVYLDVRNLACIAPAAALRTAPGAEAEQVDQVLFGERFEVLEEEGAWLFGQACRGGYVGFVEAAALAPATSRPTHRISDFRCRSGFAREVAARRSSAARPPPPNPTPC